MPCRARALPRPHAHTVPSTHSSHAVVLPATNNRAPICTILPRAPLAAGHLRARIAIRIQARHSAGARRQIVTEMRASGLGALPLPRHGSSYHHLAARQRRGPVRPPRPCCGGHPAAAVYALTPPPRRGAKTPRHRSTSYVLSRSSAACTHPPIAQQLMPKSERAISAPVPAGGVGGTAPVAVPAARNRSFSRCSASFCS